MTASSASCRRLAEHRYHSVASLEVLLRRFRSSALARFRCGSACHQITGLDAMVEEHPHRRVVVVHDRSRRTELSTVRINRSNEPRTQKVSLNTRLPAPVDATADFGCLLGAVQALKHISEGSEGTIQIIGEGLW
jgi:hypothetical protein